MDQLGDAAGSTAFPRAELLRLRVAIRGAVQGVGFRPFIHRLASRLGLAGWVNNSALGVTVEVEGPKHKLDAFLVAVETDKPPRAFIQGLESSFLDPAGYSSFEIRPSELGGNKTALVLPDIAACRECIAEVLDPLNRRYRYPFTNCTNCGPRFSIIRALPYDRSTTSMARFQMCDECRHEYEAPLDRRFHAQPNACAACGPHLELWDRQGRPVALYHDAVMVAAQALRSGKVLGVKGLGGFHLMVDARDEQTVELLRRRKHREEKPFALMFPALVSIQQVCAVSELEARLLTSPEAPIVLLARRDVARFPVPLARSVAPDNPNLAVMLPYTPLHHLLMVEIGFPVVATSGNLSDEPICIDESEAIQRLSAIADLFLVHDRPIVRHIDDSIVRVVMDREMVLRRARGYAPLPIRLKAAGPSVLALGGHLKSTVAVNIGPDVFMSQHIGDLETAEAVAAYERVVSDLKLLYELNPAIAACDAHPAYFSSGFARESGLPPVEVQHHHAHVLSCMAENQLDPPVLGVAWDGTGYGSDGTIWGGEFFTVTRDESSSRPDGAPDSILRIRRIAHFRQFNLPGGEVAVREPRRAAIGLLYEIFGQPLFSMKIPVLSGWTASELRVLSGMMAAQLNCPRTSSAGRLFDAIASIVGLKQRAAFEGQAAMMLEFAALRAGVAESYDCSASFLTDDNGPAVTGVPCCEGVRTRRVPSRPMVIDWAPMIESVLADIESGLSAQIVAAKFHNWLAGVIIAVARHAAERRVLLSGGCFQNRCLIERVVRDLHDDGFQPYWHQRVPPGDGGIALGQAFAAMVSVGKGDYYVPGDSRQDSGHRRG